MITDILNSNKETTRDIKKKLFRETKDLFAFCAAQLYSGAKTKKKQLLS
jgi:hypothetical protein